MTAAPSNPLALLPSVDRFLSWSATAEPLAEHGRQATTAAVRDLLTILRRRIGAGEFDPSTLTETALVRALTGTIRLAGAGAKPA